jgi:hypothetical protein
LSCSVGVSVVALSLILLATNPVKPPTHFPRRLTLSAIIAILGMSTGALSNRLPGATGKITVVCTKGLQVGFLQPTRESLARFVRQKSRPASMFSVSKFSLRCFLGWLRVMSLVHVTFHHGPVHHASCHSFTSHHFGQFLFLLRIQFCLYILNSLNVQQGCICL